MGGQLLRPVFWQWLQAAPWQHTIFGEILKETLKGRNNSVTDGKHFIKRKLDICYTTLFE
jgi:hypothetical protein